jgi:hypothetical protein
MVAMVVLALPLARAGAGEKLACNLKALSAPERARHQELTRAVLAQVKTTTELESGYELELAPDELVRAAEWVSLEARCCPFLDFALEQARDRGPLRLRLTGADGVKAVLRAALVGPR